MAIFLQALLVILLLFVQTLADGSDNICLDAIPGEKNVSSDTPDRVKITELAINANGDKAFIATEYLGAANLDASVYLKRRSKYCLSGELGPAYDFKAVPTLTKSRFFAIVVESRSGSDRFFRSFEYVAGRYVLRKCEIKAPRNRLRPCKSSER